MGTPCPYGPRQRRRASPNNVRRFWNGADRELFACASGAMKGTVYEAGRVTFRYKDYAHGGQERLMALSAAEFSRRFLMHVLPGGFMRIRLYGYLANRHRRRKLARCRQLLGEASPPDAPAASPAEPTPLEKPTDPCPACRSGQLRIVERWEPDDVRGASHGPRSLAPSRTREDTS